MAKPKIGCYLRVSTRDKQTTKSQREAIRQWTKSNHIRTDDLSFHEDKKSGATADRPALAKLLRAVDRGRVDTVVVFRLDRLARNLRDGLAILADLASKGIRVVSISENIDFGNSTGRLIANILLAVAEFERETTIERIRAGMAAAKESGKHVGRPRNDKKLNRIRKMFDSGMKATEIADKLGCSRANVYTALKKTCKESKQSAA
ncbi:MAG TPA: recombinase family protein [Phycisphaerae bacterium]|nr:recombinase family protein [Phycisphaerae bacterium]HRW55773.1 recombinase family protein [Phycisphaerae bacterium]